MRLRQDNQRPDLFLAAIVLVARVAAGITARNATEGATWPVKSFIQAAPYVFAQRAAASPSDASNYLNVASALWFQVGDDGSVPWPNIVLLFK